MVQIDPQVLAKLFTEARTQNGFHAGDISDETLHALYDLTKFAPTSANSEPMRIVFVKSAEAKAKLKPLMSPGNMEKTMSAPVVAILGYDMDFASHLPKLMPHVDARPWFAGTEEQVRIVALRNSSIQAGFFILAARSLGLDTGPMSGFDEAGVNAEFFAGTQIKANFIVNLGHGDSSKVFTRLPRHSFDEACSIA